MTAAKAWLHHLGQAHRRQFEGQTKAKLGNAYIRTLVDNVVNEQLAVYFEEHPQVAKAILEKAMTANRAREAARKARNPSAGRRLWAAAGCRTSCATATSAIRS